MDLLCAVAWFAAIAQLLLGCKGYGCRLMAKMVSSAPDAVVGLWLMRHGESRWNREGRAQGQAAAPGLTARGREQVRQSADRWAWSPAAPVGATAPAAVLSSDLLRARQSAEILADRLGLTALVDRRWRERSLGSAEGMPAPLDPLLTGIGNGQVVDVDAAPPGGESLRQLAVRVSDALAAATALASNGGLIVVTHGGVIRVALALLGGLDLQHMDWRPFGNAQVVRVSGLPGLQPVPPAARSRPQR